MTSLFAIIRPKNIIRKRSRVVSKVEEPISSDLSLRPSGERYIERGDEAEIILERIKKDSASVTGIGGVRGAGKSSLAMKILSRCKEDGYFTIMLPSPTAYDPKEFLLTVYQSICEDVITELQKKFRHNKSILLRGLEAARAIQFRAWALIIATCFLLSYASILMLNRKNNVDTLHALTRDKVKLASQRDILLAGLAELQYTDDTFYVVRKLYHTIDSSLLKMEDAVQLKSALTSRSDAGSYIANMYGEYLNRLDSLISLLRNSPVTYNQFHLVTRWAQASFALTILVFILLFVPLAYFIRSATKKLYLIRQFPEEWGLYMKSKEKLEGLVYQVKLSSTNEGGISVPNFNMKATRGRQMEERPLSLPGLSSDFNDYAKEVSAVFNGRLVICIDELDKIADVENLNNLLKGIKGIMGQEGSHFILTVSEDALARFSARLRSQRDLIESSFEEIYFLSRIDLNLARNIINQLYHLKTNYDASQSYDDFERNCMLVWIFGNGIPREIKRNLLVLERNKKTPLNCPPESVWRCLMSNLLDNMHSWALLNAENEVAAYNFLRCLEKTRLQLPSDKYDFHSALKWFNTFIADCSKHYALSFLQYQSLKVDDIEKPMHPDSKVSTFEKGIFEVSIAAFSILVICENTNNKQVDELVTEIQKIFALVPYSPLFAAHRFFLFLKKQEEFVLQAC